MTKSASKRKTVNDHIKRHKELHNCLDELLADFIKETGKAPSQCSIYDLLTWSKEQTENPSDKDNRYTNE